MSNEERIAELEEELADAYKTINVLVAKNRAALGDCE